MNINRRTLRNMSTVLLVIIGLALAIDATQHEHWPVTVLWIIFAAFNIIELVLRK